MLEDGELQDVRRDAELGRGRDCLCGWPVLATQLAVGVGQGVIFPFRALTAVDTALKLHYRSTSSLLHHTTAPRSPH